MKISVSGEASKRTNYIKSATGPKLIAAGELSLDELGQAEVLIPYFGDWAISKDEDGNEIVSTNSLITVQATENASEPSGPISVQIESNYQLDSIFYKVKFKGPILAKIFYSATSCGVAMQGTRLIGSAP